MSAAEIAAFLEQFPHMDSTICGVCGQATLYARYDPHGGQPQLRRQTPKSCGRLACAVKVGEATPVGS